MAVSDQIARVEETDLFPMPIHRLCHLIQDVSAHARNVEVPPEIFLARSDQKHLFYDRPIATNTPSTQSQTQRVEVPSEIKIPLENFLARSDIKHLFYDRPVATNNLAWLEVDPSLYVTVPGRIYDFLVCEMPFEIPMTRDDFVLIAQKLLVLRLRYIQDAASGVDGDEDDRMHLSIKLPRPMYDLFRSIGIFSSRVTGHRLAFRPDPASDPVTSAWKFGEGFADWNSFMRRIQPFYEIAPVPREVDGTPIGMTFWNGQSEVTSRTNELALTDGHVRLANEHNLWKSVLPWDYDNCHILLTRRISPEYFRVRYIRSYMIDDVAVSEAV